MATPLDSLLTSVRAQLTALDTTLEILQKELSAATEPQYESSKLTCPQCGGDTFSEMAAMGSSKSQYQCLGCRHWIEGPPSLVE